MHGSPLKKAPRQEDTFAKLISSSQERNRLRAHIKALFLKFHTPSPYNQTKPHSELSHDAYSPE